MDNSIKNFFKTAEFNALKIHNFAKTRKLAFWMGSTIILSHYIYVYRKFNKLEKK